VLLEEAALQERMLFDDLRDDPVDGDLLPPSPAGILTPAGAKPRGEPRSDRFLPEDSDPGPIQLQ